MGSVRCSNLPRRRGLSASKPDGRIRTLQRVHRLAGAAGEGMDQLAGMLHGHLWFFSLCKGGGGQRSPASVRWFGMEAKIVKSPAVG